MQITTTEVLSLSAAIRGGDNLESAAKAAFQSYIAAFPADGKTVSSIIEQAGGEISAQQKSALERVLLRLFVQERRREVDGLVEAGAMIYIPKRDLGAFREKAGMSSWVALSKRAGVHQWHFSYANEDAMTGNFTLPIWLRVSLALGRHPFAIAQVAGPVGAFDMSPYQKVYRRPGADVWGWEPEEIDAAVESEQAKIVLDPNNLADVQKAAGLPTRRSLEHASGLSYPTLQKLNYPKNNPSVASVMRIALACRVHPYSLLQVRFPPM